MSFKGVQTAPVVESPIQGIRGIWRRAALKTAESTGGCAKLKTVTDKTEQCA